MGRTKESESKILTYHMALGA